MKKVFTVLILAVLLLSGCQNASINENTDDKKDISEYARLIYSSYENDQGLESISESDDFDFDGEKEDIDIIFEKKQYDEYNVFTDTTVEIEGASYFYSGLEDMGYEVTDVYLCDIDSTDKAKEIAIFYIGGSSDPYAKILRYENGQIRPLSFHYEYADENGVMKSEENESLYLGYIPYPDMEAVAPKTIRLNTMLNSGMWCCKTLYKEDNGVISMQKEDYYEIQTDLFLKPFKETGEKELSDIGYIESHEEYEKLKENYLLAHETYKADEEERKNAPKRDEISLNKGEYFTLLYEDNNGYVCIQKEDGDKGWIYLPGFGNNRYEVSPMGFFMAG